VTEKDWVGGRPAIRQVAVLATPEPELRKASEQPPPEEPGGLPRAERLGVLELPAVPEEEVRHRRCRRRNLRLRDG
jgi:hypothetical protein